MFKYWKSAATVSGLGPGGCQDCSIPAVLWDPVSDDHDLLGPAAPSRCVPLMLCWAR